MSEKATISPQNTPAAPGAAQSLSAQNDLRKDESNQKKPENSILFVQPKLTVGAPDDPYEKEADAMADRVMRMPETSFIQRKCAGCEKEESVQRKPEEDEEGVQLKVNGANSFIQRKCQSCEEEKIHRKPLSEGITPFIQAKSASSTVVTSNAADTIQSSRGSGSTLDSATQSFMSTRFGADFTSVKVHTDSNAVQLSRGLNAKAFTVGSDIYFNQGTFSPNTSEGKQLLAHELTHTLQQGGSTVRRNAEQEDASKIDRSGAGSFIQRKVQNQLSSAPPEITNLPKPEVQPKEISRQLPGLYNVISPIPPPDDPHSSATSARTGGLQRKDDSGSASSFNNLPARILKTGVPYNNSSTNTLVQRKCATCESEVKVQRKAHPGNFSKTALNSSAAPFNAETAKLSSTPTRIIQRNIVGDAWDATGGRVVSAVGDAASTVYDAAGNVISGAIEWVEDRAESIINRIAPGLLDFLRGDIIQNIKDALARAVDAATGGLFSRLQAEGLQGVLEDFVSSIISTMSGAVENGCRAFAILAQKILDFIRTLGGAALQRIVAFFRRVGGLLSSFWNNFALPIWDAIKSFAGTVWEWITSTAAWLWELIRPIRETIARAWNWLMRQFGIAWRAGGSVLDWLKGKAQQAWNWLMGLIEPIKTPLMIIGGVLLMLSPLGPIVAIGAGAYALYRGIQWVRENWNSEVFVRFRNYLKEHVLDVISNGIESLKNSVIGAFGWLTSTLLSLQAPIIRLLQGIGAIAVFRFIRAGIQSFANVITRAVNWAGARLAEVGRHIINVARDIWEFLRPYAIILAKLSILALNPWLLPPVLAAWAWRILPNCFKPPIINFVIGVMISVLRAMPDFKLFGETWPQVKQQIIQFLQNALGADDTEKITAANRIARMVSELDLELISNQIEAARLMPSQFEGQIEEELLGMDLTRALPFERTGLPSISQSLQPSHLTDAIPEEDARLFGKSSFSEEEVGVDEVGTFEPGPELIEEFRRRAGGEEGVVEFGHSSDPSRTVHGILSDMVPASELPVPGNPAGTQYENPAPQTAALTSPSPLSQEEETERRLQETIAQSQQTMATQACTPSQQPSPQPEGAASSDVAESDKFGPLTRSQRARYTLSQMRAGLGHWWSCNRSWLLPTIIAAIVVLVIAEVLTGGAITGALPAIFGALAPIMIGVAVIRGSIYLGEYVYKSIGGDIIGAARSLARAIAVAAVELTFALLGSSAFWKSVGSAASRAGQVAGRAARAISRVIPASEQVGRGALRIAEAGVTLGRAGARGLRAAGRTALSSAHAFVQRGRIILRGIRGRFGQGIRTLEELAERLFARLRHRILRLIRRGGRTTIEGCINPCHVCLTSGVDLLPNVPGRGRLGTTVGGGLVVGAETAPSALVRALTSDPALRQRLLSLVAHPDFSHLGESIVQGLRNIQNAHPGGLSRALQTIEHMASRIPPVPGLATLISDLGQGGNKFLGASFVLNFLERNPGMLFSLQRLESRVVASSGARIIDAVIDGVRFEFKNWEVFRPQTFLTQILRDIEIGGDFRWVLNDRIFTGAIQSADDVLAAAQAAILSSGNPTLINRMADILDQIYIVSLQTGRIH